MNVEQLLAEASRRHQLGDRGEAAELYSRVLAAEPRNHDALRNLGIILAAEGHHEHAGRFLAGAMKSRPDSIETLLHLADCCLKLRRFDDAEAACRRALELAPNHHEAKRSLRAVAEAKGRHEESLRAAESLRQSLAVHPNVAKTHGELAAVLMELGQRDAALECYRQAFALDPHDIDLLKTIADLSKTLGRPDHAIACYEHALAHGANDSRSHNLFGLIFTDLGRRPEALECFRRALAVDPADSANHVNCGSVLASLGHRDEAMRFYDAALALEPDCADAHFHRAIVLLLTGDLERGWPEYRWRWRLDQLKDVKHDRPVWDGSDLAGRSILLQSEQGFGDTIQFVRYAALVREAGGSVTIEAPRSLVELLATCPGVDRVVESGQPIPPTDFCAPLLDLPAILRSATVPATIPYLFPTADRVEFWRQQLSAAGGLRIGIAWQGNVTHKGDRERSIPAGAFARLAAIPGVRLFSLQKDGKLPTPPPFPVTDLAGQLDTFMETAAVMKNLDLVVTVDTAVAHLAGALGVPVWVALPFVPDWRWLLDREDSPWYPTMWLVRQPRPGDWRDVFERIAWAVESFVR